MKKTSKAEAKKILAVIMIAYQNYKPYGDIDMIAALWADMLSEYDYNQVDAALKAYIASDESGFAPNIGQIIGKIQSIAKPIPLNEMEAWSMVRKAIQNSGYNSEEEYSKLPPTVQKAVGGSSQLRVWALDERYNEQVASSNFMRTYHDVVKQEAELMKLPNKIKNMIGSASKMIGQKE